MDQHDPHLSNAVMGLLAKRRRHRRLPVKAPLGQQLHAGYRMLQVAWGNPHTSPPDGAECMQWQCTVPETADYRAFMAEHAPAYVLGSGWCIRIGTHRPPRASWSEEAKGRVRRGNLRKRLDKAVPLFADMFFAEEVARRADYFAGKPYEATLPPRDRAADACADGAGIGHNSGAGPKPAASPLQREY